MADKKIIKQLINTLTFDQNGLIPAIAQQYNTGEVLMMAWMNKESISTTLMENRVVYWSRSRQSLWRKGDTSGQIQKLLEFRWDCDTDTLLLQVDQTGVACHTGRRTCFFNAIKDDKIAVISDIKIDPDILYKQ
jgi:phosphoribosyl-AMP cyclohydrolase